MKLGRAGHNRRKPKEQKVNEHSFPWLPYLTPLFSTHTSCYSAPFVLSVKSSSRAEQERALPRHVPAVTHGSRAQCWDQHCGARHKNMFRPLTARLKSVHVCAETLSWQPPHRWWVVTKVTRNGKVAELILLHRTGALCPAPNAGSLLCAIVCYLSPWHLAASLANSSNVRLIISICNWMLR